MQAFLVAFARVQSACDSDTDARQLVDRSVDHLGAHVFRDTLASAGAAGHVCALCG